VCCVFQTKPSEPSFSPSPPVGQIQFQPELYNSSRGDRRRYKGMQSSDFSRAQQRSLNDKCPGSVSAGSDFGRRKSCFGSSGSACCPKCCQEIEGLEEDEDIQPGVPVASSEPDRLVETKTSHPQPQPIVTMKEGAIGVPSACPQVVRSPSSEPGFPFPNETQAVTQAPGILARLVAWVKSWLPSSWLQSSPQEVKAPVKDAPDLTSDRSMPLSFSNMVIGLAVSIIALALLKRSLPLKYYADLVRLLVV